MLMKTPSKKQVAARIGWLVAELFVVLVLLEEKMEAEL